MALFSGLNRGLLNYASENTQVSMPCMHELHSTKATTSPLSKPPCVRPYSTSSSSPSPRRNPRRTNEQRRDSHDESTTSKQNEEPPPNERDRQDSVEAHRRGQHLACIEFSNFSSAHKSLWWTCSDLGWNVFVAIVPVCV